MAFLGAETALPCVLGRRVANSPARGPGSQNRRDLWGRDSGRHFGAGFLRGFGGGLEDAREVPPGARPCRAGFSHPIGPTEGKPARRSTDDYARFFVETVPKRYKFGTGAPCKWLDSA